MRLFHRCTFEEAARIYTPPKSSGFSVDRAGEEFVQQLTFGVTTVELRCSKCGDISERRLIGRVMSDDYSTNS